MDSRKPLSFTWSQNVRTLLDAVEALGPEEGQFAQHMRELVRGYDMEGVLGVLSGMRTND